MKLKLFILVALTWVTAAQDVKITEAERTVDISTQLVKVNTLFTINNGGQVALSEVTFLVTEQEQDHLAHIIASVDRKEAVIKKSSTNLPGFATYTVTLPKKLAAASSQAIAVDYVLTEALSPFPEQITQEETQYVVYNGNGYFSSAYPVSSQKTTINLGSGKLLTFTPVSPSKQIGEKVVYGPYSNQPAKALVEVKVHYENVSPFIVAASVDRHIEISHWGNIAVEEKIQIVHRGAALTGSFSRLDFQLDRRGRKQPCVKEFKTVLPASSRDIYYRDVIGNISSSSVRVRSESVEVEIRPRFPLFGGWKTNYVLGYNVPSYEYLFAEGNKFALKMRVLDHIYDNMVVERLTTRVVLPEKATNIKLTTPFPVTRKPDEKLATYLDTEGRTVVVLEKEDLIDAHIQNFVLEYNWNRVYIWREPLIASAFLFCLFLAVIVYVRFDFDITKDAKSEARLGLAAKVEVLRGVLTQRAALHQYLIDAVGKYKESMNDAALDAAKKKLEGERAELKKKIAAAAEDVKASAPHAGEKLTDIENAESGIIGAEKAYVEKAVKTATKNGPEDKAWASRVADAMKHIENILSSI